MERNFPYHNEKYIGMIFGTWRVISLVEGNGWMCKCSKCGRKTMRNGHKVICGDAEKCICDREKEKVEKRFPIGKKIGHLTILGEYDYSEQSILCKCDCGNVRRMKISYLKKKDCKNEQAYCGRDCKYTKINNMNYGYTNKRIVGIWNCMKSRCYSTKNPGYKNWGGRGISICDEWRFNYKSFENWALSHGYADNLSIDRIDNEGNYCPENCRWTTIKEQNKNRRKLERARHNKTKKNMFTIDGVTKSLAEWCDESGILTQTVTYRMKKKGMDIKTALTSPKETTGRPLKECL